MKRAMNAERLKIRLNRTLRRIAAVPRLHRIDRHRIPPRHPGEVWLFMVCRNEALRLPCMLEHHFRLGVARVFLLDNASTDATTDLVRGDSRVHVYRTSQSFAGNKIAWQELLLRRHGIGHWNLVLDADELLAYPGMDSVPLPEYVRRLDAEGAEAIHALFIDMYSRGPIRQLRYAPGEDLLAAAPWFDPAGYVKIPYRQVFGSGKGSTFVCMGGARARAFGGEFGCSKIPLLKYRPGQFLRLGFHTIEGARLSSHQAAVLHFKYLQDFHEKVSRESSRNVYWNGAAEYKAYAALLEKNPDFTLWHPGAVRYESWRSLADAGLVF